MSPRTDLDEHVALLEPDDDYILIRLSPDGHVTSISTLDEEDAVELLRDTADEIEQDGFERPTRARLS